MSLEARVNGLLSQCVDLHQNGAGIITTEAALRKNSNVRVEIACHDLSGKIVWATGQFRIRSKKRIEGTKETVRAGGRITWDNAESKTAVIMQCYVVEQYVARQHFWLRNERRRVVLLPAHLDGIDANCVDVSTSGASFVASEADWGDRQVGIRIPIAVDSRFFGTAEIRNVTATTGDLVRVGAAVTWQNPFLLKVFSESEKLEQRTRKSMDLGINP